MVFNLSSHYHSNIVKWYMKCFIYWTADLKSSKLWSSQLWTKFKQLRIEAWKSQDFNGVWTLDLVIPGRRSNQLSYEIAFMTAMIIAYLISKSAVQYMKHFIYHFTSILHRLIRTHKWDQWDLKTTEAARISNHSGLFYLLTRKLEHLQSTSELPFSWALCR